MRLTKAHIKVIMAALVLLAGAFFCSRPASDEAYVKSSQRDEWGRYEFAVDMADSLISGYDADIVIALECGAQAFESFGNMPLTMVWKAPSDMQFEEKVWVSRNDLSENSMFSKRFQIKYRYGIVPYELGLWRLYISIPEDFIYEYNISGIGLKVSRKQ